jgi:hypothetical protein
MAREMVAQPAGGSAGAGKPTIDEIKGKLRDLKGLLAEGLITQEDFDEQKKRLLGLL